MIWKNSDAAKVHQALATLERYCYEQDYRGYDPYDGLNSRMFRATPFYHSRLFRLVWIQFFKRSTVNLRRVLLVPRRHNAKAMALFVSGYCALYRTTPDHAIKIKIDRLMDILYELALPGYHGFCWGYPFDWQAKAFYVPEGTPNLVTVSFIVQALLEHYQLFHDEKSLHTARSCCDFISKDMILHEDDRTLCFAYIPGSRVAVHNVNVLAAAALAMTGSLTGEPALLNDAAKAIRYTVQRQNPDGSWFYGEEPYHHWIDNFHTGYNLCAIKKYQDNARDDSFHSSLVKGYDYFLNELFGADGLPQYYSTKKKPYDVHTFTQAILTYLEFGALDGNAFDAAMALTRAMNTMFKSKSGYFYYQKNRLLNKIPYMRWTQAWVFLTLCRLTEVMHARHLD
jgi:hypothetical protein